MFREIAEDFRAFRDRDPSVPKGMRGALEVALCAPGFHALLGHRIAHRLHRLGVPVLPRLISVIFRWWTGIEIHPGAKIGKGILIDHGSGVVIGESAVVKDRCVIFQGVTLGATGNERQWQRHPILEEDVVVGSGAKILGPITVGRGAKIGANSVVLSPVPPFTTMVGPKARPVKGPGAAHVSKRPEPWGLMDAANLSATAANKEADLLRRIEALEREVMRLKREMRLKERKDSFEEVAI
ncbi:MAG: serine O-acetyltransferase [Thermanaerothrix sp.]|nr:serine O-acetyltransferase [Thermanaerothrix sp.]